MGTVVYLGDEVSAAGWRVAGATVHTPAPGDEAAALAGACTSTPAPALVLLSATVAGAIDEPPLRRALSALSPLVLIVPDLRGETPLPDLAARLRSQLGLEA